MSTSNLADHGLEGVEGMDREHAVEMQIVRSLQKALMDEDLDTAGELMKELEDFTNAHFLAEQLLMRLHAYPAYEAHQQEHDQLIAELSELRHSLAGGVEDPSTAVEAIERWLQTHIHTSDEDLANYLKQSADGATTGSEPAS